MGDAEKPDYEMALVNPVILSQSSDKKLGEEGCLSFPMIYGHVERSEWIEVLCSFVNQTLHGVGFLNVLCMFI
jgi:peptide deformylase